MILLLHFLLVPAAGADLGGETAESRHLPEQQRFGSNREDSSSGLRVDRASPKAKAPSYPPRPPTARPKGPSGVRTPTPPPSGRIEPSSAPIVVAPAAPPRARVRTLDWPPRST